MHKGTMNALGCKVIKNASHKKVLRSDAHSSHVSKLFQGMTVLHLYKLKATLFSQILKLHVTEQEQGEPQIPERWDWCSNASARFSRRAETVIVPLHVLNSKCNCNALPILPLSRI